MEVAMINLPAHPVSYMVAPEITDRSP